jgi:hypothetical protein
MTEVDVRGCLEECYGLRSPDDDSDSRPDGIRRWIHHVQTIIVLVLDVRGDSAVHRVRTGRKGVVPRRKRHRD